MSFLFINIYFHHPLFEISIMTYKGGIKMNKEIMLKGSEKRNTTLYYWKNQLMML